MKNKSIKKKFLGKKNTKGGFTLIELLAVIALLSIVSVLAVYTINNVISTAKDESYKVSINNIEQEAGNFAIENSNDIVWTDIDDADIQYFCVKVQDLIGKGYFNNDVLKSEVSNDIFVDENDSVYLERNKNSKSTTKNILLFSGREGEYQGYCDTMSSTGIINFDVEPSGWSREKDITITYTILNDEGNYSYDYEFIPVGDGNVESCNDCNDVLEKKKVKTVTIDSNGSLKAVIKDGNEIIVEKTLNISKIDSSAPTVELIVNDGSSYKTSNTASVELKDNGSGFKIGKYKIYYEWSTKILNCEQIKKSNKSVTVSVEENNSLSSTNASVTISNLSGVGRFYACTDNVTDYVGNGMKDTVVSEDMWLDNDRPIISLGNYTSTESATGKTEIILKATDVTSKVKDGSFTKEDIVVTVGGSRINTNNLTLTRDGASDNYKLVINNKTENGKVVITIEKDKIEDLAGNKNLAVTLEPNISFMNVYKIYYNANGGSGTMSPTECKYNESCTLNANKFTKTGNTFLGWSTSSSATSVTYGDKYTFDSYNIAENMTLYAVWKANTVTIKYNVNGGTVTASTANGNYTTDSNGLIFRNGSVLTTVVNYGENIGSSGLTNYNNSSWLEVKKTGYAAVSSNEWKCLGGCTTSGKTYNQATVYKASDFCDASNSSCEVTLGVNWTPKVLTVTFMRNYSSSDTTKVTQKFTYGVSGQKFASGFTRTGYTPSGWSYTQSGTTVNQSWTSGVSDAWIEKYYPSITLYAVWDANAVTIQYSVNGGKIATTSNDDGTWSSNSSGLVLLNGNLYTTKINYGASLGSDGLTNYNNSAYLNISKNSSVAISSNEWKCLSGCSVSGKTYNQATAYSASDFCDASNGSCTVTLGVNWKVNTYTITYNLNGGVSGANAPTSGEAGSTVTVSNPTRSGFEFKGWTVSGTGASISGTSLKIGDGNITLTANWTVNLVEYIEYLYNDSSLRSDSSLQKDTSSAANIRYVGSSPKNYIKYDDELWRIVGVFNVSNGSTTSKRVKLVRENILLNASWDSSSSSVNNGRGINEWSQADIKTVLNDYYVGSSSSCNYCNAKCESTCSNSCVSTVGKMGTTAKSLIENAVWNLGGLPYDDDDGDYVNTVLDSYNKERGSRTGKECSYNENCTDSVSRNTTWTGMVGLVYISDYGYASTNSNCRTNITYNTNCQYNNWMSTGTAYWTITPRDSTTFANAAWYVSANNISDTTMYHDHGIRPAVYLKASASIKDGDGTSSNPFEFDV